MKCNSKLWKLTTSLQTPTPTNECPDDDTKQSDGEAPVMLECGVPLNCHRSQVHSGQKW